VSEQQALSFLNAFYVAKIPLKYTLFLLNIKYV
jgi:hypothetical protein